MGVFDRMIEMAKRQITKYGQKVTWRILENGSTPDPAKPWRPVNSPSSDHECVICFIPVNKENMQFFAYLARKEIVSGTVLGLMASVDFNPSMKDIVIRDNVEYQIQNIDLVSPNGQKILYIIEFKT